MRQKQGPVRGQSTDHKEGVDRLIRNIKRQPRRKFNVEEKVRIALAGLRGEDSIAKFCRKEGLDQNLYYRWVILRCIHLQKRLSRQPKKFLIQCMGL